MSDTVAAVVVSYNRKELLIKCLEALRNQTHKPDAIFIIDNKSNDGTPEFLLDKKYIPKLPVNDSNENQLIKHRVCSLNNPYENIETNYIRKCENDGGAGGFFEGMKQAYKERYDWIWMMDDDGIPDENQLSELLKAPPKYKFRNALVVDINDYSNLAFGLKGYNKVIKFIEKKYIENRANPFNGTLIHRDIPKKIGFIKKEMFIWGDEKEYMLRIRRSNIKIITISKAIHFHPESKATVQKFFFGLINIPIKPYPICFLYYRNMGFLHSTYNKKALFKFFAKFSFYYLFIKLSIKDYKLFLKYYLDGWRNSYSLPNSSIIDNH